MKFQIGSIMSWDKGNEMAINLPGIGVVKVEGKDAEGFEYIELNRNQLKKLQRQIQKELERTNGKKSELE